MAFCLENVTGNLELLRFRKKGVALGLPFLCSCTKKWGRAAPDSARPLWYQPQHNPLSRGFLETTTNHSQDQHGGVNQPTLLNELVGVQGPVFKDLKSFFLNSRNPVQRVVGLLVSQGLARRRTDTREVKFVHVASPEIVTFHGQSGGVRRQGCL